MRILLTRAKADAERTATKLAARGHSVIISPVIEIVETQAAIPSGRFDAIIGTSAHAFTSGTRMLANIPLYAVGERTREAALRAALRLDSQATDAQIVPSKLDVIVVYNHAPNASYFRIVRIGNDGWIP